LIQNQILNFLSLAISKKELWKKKELSYERILKPNPHVPLMKGSSIPKRKKTPNEKKVENTTLTKLDTTVEKGIYFENTFIYNDSLFTFYSIINLQLVKFSKDITFDPWNNQGKTIRMSFLNKFQLKKMIQAKGF
jgi:hypothetical protein